MAILECPSPASRRFDPLSFTPLTLCLPVLTTTTQVDWFTGDYIRLHCFLPFCVAVNEPRWFVYGGLDGWQERRTSDGNLVNAGKPDSDGMNVNRWNPRNQDGNLGVSLSRSADTKTSWITSACFLCH